MLTYRIDVADAHAHLFRVSLTLPAPRDGQRLSLPVWIPGSYLVREFARHLSGLTVSAGTLAQVDKATWVWSGESSTRSVTVSWLAYAFDTSVRAAFLDAHRGFFNPTSLCLRAEGREAEPHRIDIKRLPAGWQVATALAAGKVDANGRGTYEAADYDELADSPFELGRFWRGTFTAGGVAHELVVSGALPDADLDRLLADTQQICAAEIAFWHGRGRGAKKPPFTRYVFLLNLVEDSHGGLEHRASTALLGARRAVPERGKAGALAKSEASDAYVSLLGLISHEYFHTWNVKRLRPAEFERYDYTQENYTELLWFFEGFTSYYDDLFLVRAKLIDSSRYLKLVSRTLSAVLGQPGRHVQSLAEASFDAWVKYYRADENTPNATISYYTKGSLVALALDLTLRAEGHGTLDDVMRALWANSSRGPRAGLITEADIAAALQQIGGRSFAPELAAWVHGTDDLPLPALLAAVGIDWHHQPATLAQRLGLRASESALTGIKLSHVLRGGAAEQAGLSPGDEVLAVNRWRVRRLDDALRVLVPGKPAELLIARDQRVITLALTLPADAAASGAVSLQAGARATAAALALQKAWLAG